MKRFLLLCVALYMLSVFCHKQTDGFALTKVSTALLETPSSSGQFIERTFHYLGKGGQSYVFISEDGHLVLKLLRSSRLNTLQFLYRLLPLPLIKEKIQIEEKQIEKTLQSYAIAASHLKEETGLIAVHLDSHEKWDGTLKIVDKGKVSHIMDPNRYPFIIQERAILVKERITQFMEQNDLQAAQEALRSLFALIQVRLAKGIEDYDPNLTKNFGFCGSQPIQIDGGRFELSPTLSLEKIQHSKEDLQHWINQYHPTLAQDFHKAYEDFLDEAL